MDSKLIESTCSYTLIKLSQKLPKYIVMIQDNLSQPFFAVTVSNG